MHQFQSAFEPLDVAAVRGALARRMITMERQAAGPRRLLSNRPPRTLRYRSSLLVTGAPKTSVLTEISDSGPDQPNGPDLAYKRMTSSRFA
jgi:hypothetical protein